MHRSRRAVILLSVLVLITISALVGSTLMLQSRAVRGATDRTVGRAQSRALAWSGVQIVMAELASTREQLLDGIDTIPEVEGVVYQADGGTEGVYRLLPVDAMVISPENAKLDLNTATREILAKLPGLDSQIAGAIVARRDRARFTSAEELLDIDGIDALMLYGDQGDEGLGFETGIPVAQQGRDVGRDVGGGGALASYVTVFSFDPQIQAGVLRDESHGKRRVSLNIEWSEELGDATEEAFGAGARSALKQLFDQGATFEKPSDILKHMDQAGIGTEMWGGVLDVFTTSSGEFAFGRVDINHAPAAVLACLPGLDVVTADAIVDMRQNLDPEDRRSVTWVLDQEVVEKDGFIELVDWITTRSMQWRLLIEAGTRVQQVTAGEDFGAGNAFDPSLVTQELRSDEFGSLIEDEDQEPELLDRVVYEAVIDVSADRPRLAHLADVTNRAFLLKSVQTAAAADVEVSYAGGSEPTVSAEDQADGADSGYVDDADGFGIDRGGYADLDGFGEQDAQTPSEDDAYSGDQDGGAAPRTQSTASSGAGRIGRWRAGQGGDE